PMEAAMRRTFLALALFTLAIGSATAQDNAPAATPQARDCFPNEQIDHWRQTDAQTVQVYVHARRSYLLTLAGDARRLRFVMSIALQSPGDWICTGHEPGVMLHSLSQIHGDWVIENVARAPLPGAAAAP